MYANSHVNKVSFIILKIKQLVNWTLNTIKFALRHGFTLPPQGSGEVP